MVTVTDALGTTASGAVTVTVIESLAADFTFSPLGTTGIFFNGRGDSDGNGFGSTGNIVSYAWHIETIAGAVHDVVCPSSSPQCRAFPEIFVFEFGTETGAARGTATLTVTAADGRTASRTRSYR